jgi:hypothetical protein
MATTDTQNPVLAAVDRLMQVHDAWVENPDPTYRHTPPREFEETAEALFEACIGQDMPAEMRAVMRSIEDFQVQWQLYAGGARERNGEAKGSLWRAFRQLDKDRRQQSELRPKRPEPVHELYRQNVSPTQIAQQIYGHNGEGPFLERGAIRYDLLEKERANPGSVVEANWLPPYEIERLRSHNISLKKRDAAIDERIESSERKHEQNPISLLREGQFVDVIARVCNLTEPEVLGIAKAIGVEPTYRTPLTGNVRGPYDPPLRPSDAVMLDSMAAKPAAPANSSVKHVPKGTTARVHELFAAGLGAPEIAEQIGHGLTARDIAKLLNRQAG